MRINTRRPGITLLEVLAAIFIMGVGMLAILVLFPLGAINMARALRDDRLGHIAYSADSLGTARDLHLDPTVIRHMTLPPEQVLPPGSVPAGAYLPPDPAGPSYPVFVDPYYARQIGFQVFSAMPQSPIGRLSPPWVRAGQAGQYDVERNFSLQDDLTFDADGKPKTTIPPPGPPPPNGIGLERQGYYTWSYMFRRSVTANASTTEMHVIVYSGRPVNLPAQEPYFDLATPGLPGATTIVLNQSPNGVMPALRRGYWLFDVSYRPSVNPPNTYGRVNANFYRVIEATKISPTQVQVAIEPPLKNDADYTMTRVVSLENAVEVFDRGSGR